MKEFVYQGPDTGPEQGAVHWEAPSNIALVKYWGKHGNQLPMNPSLSFTLDACHTRTRLEFFQSGGSMPVEVLLDGQPAPSFEPKIRQFLERALPFQPFLKGYGFRVHTHNSFPHSSGIASSASGMAALALCLMDLERLFAPGLSAGQFRRKASFLARLGSGSAARSVDGGLVLWGTHPGLEGSSDAYGVPYPEKVHPVFQDYHDTILLVDKGEKAVSSTVGHGLMDGHPFAGARFEQARQNLDRLGPVLAAGDLDGFVDLVESEALTLHAMMLSSSPSFILMKPGTLAILEKLRAFRKTSGHPVCFTLDAGANVHVLYPAASREAVYPFIQEALLEHCHQGHHICDRVGRGARRLAGAGS
ncbi:diphosphomevalonate decarboxylase [Robiginitalea aestuariiviva]|uniref:diphosphomevalonate/mevalonate 3,5-bisphosphate decarboxylase family protein n=1 Tax=Robiginitalea aestuariiviva TaxID=3036903 RepID=UPI0030C6B3D3